MRDEIIVMVRPQDINYANRIMEGYEYLGLVNTIDKVKGKLIVRVTPDTYKDALEVIKKLKRSYKL